MREIVDQALGDYELTSKMDAAELAQSRDRITRYLDKLISAGQADPHQLTEYARAYLKEMHEGPDPRFTGCWSRLRIAGAASGSGWGAVVISSREGTIEGEASSSSLASRSIKSRRRGGSSLPSLNMARSRSPTSSQIARAWTASIRKFESVLVNMSCSTYFVPISANLALRPVQKR
jgi:hypothetical protein